LGHAPSGRARLFLVMVSFLVLASVPSPWPDHAAASGAVPGEDQGIGDHADALPNSYNNIGYAIGAALLIAAVIPGRIYLQSLARGRRLDGRRQRATQRNQQRLRAVAVRPTGTVREGPLAAGARAGPARSGHVHARFQEQAAKVSRLDLAELRQRDLKRDIEARFALALDALAVADREFASGNYQSSFLKYQALETRLWQIFLRAEELEDPALLLLVLRERETLQRKIEDCRSICIQYRPQPEMTPA
jgi:hypothetical protein